MAATVTATGDKPNYHLSLSDGENTLGLIAESALSIRRLPRGPGVERKAYVQQDWTSGRGHALPFSKDTARFYDSGRLWSTSAGMILNGPLFKYGKNYRNLDQHLPGSVTWHTLTTSAQLARSFVASATYSADKCQILVRKVGSPTGTLTFELCIDSSGSPGTVLKTVTDGGAQVDDWLSVLAKFDWATTQSLTSGVTYWLKIYDAGTPNARNHWEVGVLSAAAASGNLLTNGDFETGTSSGWTFIAATFVDTTHHNGLYSMRLYRASPDSYPSPPAGAIEARTANASAPSVTGGTFYTVGAWLKYHVYWSGGAKVAATLNFKVRWYSAASGGGSLLREDTLYTVSYSIASGTHTTVDWFNKAFSLQAPSGALSAIVVFEQNATSLGVNASYQDFFADDVTFETTTFTGKISNTIGAWTTQTSAADNAWRGIAWSPSLSLFAAVGFSGVGNRVMTSSDGVNWTTRTSAADNAWYDIAWSPELSLFAAVADSAVSDAIMTSPNGTTWTARTTPVNVTWTGIAWSPTLGMFAAVARSGSNNRIMTSSDGVTWTGRTSPADNDWRGIVWAEALGLFVAIASTGTGNRVMTSPNGIDWTTRASAADNGWRAIAWSPELGLLVAVSDTGAGNRVMTSPNGIDWTTRASAADNLWRGLAWSSTLGLFAATAQSGTNNRLMTSPNGIDWTVRTSPADNNWNRVAWSPSLGLFAAVAESGTGNRVMTGTTGSVTWDTTNKALYYRVTDADPTVAGNAHFFEYKRQLYLATNPETGNGVVYVNGDRGVATGTQSTTTLKDTTKAWTTSEWVGSVALIYKGTNKGLSRLITANDATTLTVDPAWPAACATGASGSEYVIVGSDKWTTVSAGATGPITGVAVFNEIVYLACGDGANLRRFREFNNAGAWTLQSADDGTNKAVHLQPYLDSTAAIQLYRTLNSDSTFSHAAAVAWGTNLTFSASKKVGDLEAYITGLTVYDNNPWIAKEDSLWKIVSDTPSQVNIDMKPFRDEHNGEVIRQWNTNLYFSLLSGLERLFETTINDIGPNRDAGLPEKRRGRVSAFVPVPNAAYLGYDAEAGLSSLYATLDPGGSWHEIFRPWTAGHRVRGLYYQSVPKLANRLWVWLDGAGDIGYLTMPDDTASPLNDVNMRYTWESYVTTSWFDSDSPELDHFFDELRVMTRNLPSTSSGSGSGGKHIEADYQVDDANDESPWLRFTNDALTSPHEILSFGDGVTTGRRVRYRLRLLTDGESTPVIVQSAELRANTMNEVLYDYIVDIGLADKMVLLNGADETQTMAAKLAQLEAWQEDATPLTAHCVIPAFDNIICHIDPVSLVPASWSPDETKLTGSLTLKQT